MFVHFTMVELEEGEQIMEQNEAGMDIVVEHSNLRRIRVLCKRCGQLFGYFNEFLPYDRKTRIVSIDNLECNSQFYIDTDKKVYCNCHQHLGSEEADEFHIKFILNSIKLEH